MPALQYRGAPAVANADLVYKDYVGQVKNADLTVAEIDNVINTGLAGYATIAYTDSRDALNASKAYVDAGDAQRLHLSQKTIASGVVPLDATGRVPPVRINAPLTQKWVRGPWTPPTYYASPVSITATETTLYTCPVTDPGYPYKLIVFGMLDARPDRETEYPIVNVRVGAVNGEIVAQGLGPLDVPDASDPLNGEKFSTPNPDGLEPELWNQTSFEGNANSFYKVEGGQATWNESGNQDQEWRYRRLGADALTLTNYQKARLTIGTNKGESPIFGDPHRVRLCVRMNEAETDWVGFELTHNTFTMQYSVDDVIRVMPTTGGWTVSPGPSFSTSPDPGTTYDVLAGTVNNLRQFLFFRNEVLIGGAVDGSAATKVGPAYRGWGWHGRATSFNFFQNNPPDIADLLITDAPPSFGSMSIVPFNQHLHAVRNGPTTLYIRGARSGSASTCMFTPYRPRLNIFAVSA